MIELRDATLLHTVCVYAMFTCAKRMLSCAVARGKSVLFAVSLIEKETGDKPF